MGMTNMLTLAVYLDPVPGGVAPELHLKEGSSSVEADLFILDASSFENAKQKDCVIRGTRPDGSELFRRLYTGIYDTRLQIHLFSGDVRELSKAAGTYRCTLTLLDTDSHPTRETYQNYNFLTVLPFTVIVHEKAGREEDAV